MSQKAVDFFPATPIRLAGGKNEDVQLHPAMGIID
jgi:hypothetical protein